MLSHKCRFCRVVFKQFFCSLDCQKPAALNYIEKVVSDLIE